MAILAVKGIAIINSAKMSPLVGIEPGTSAIPV